MKRPTYAEIYGQWCLLNPKLVKKVDDYRPADGVAIRIWFKDGCQLVYVYNFDI